LSRPVLLVYGHMKKPAPKDTPRPHRRAFVNPTKSLPEAAQREIILKSGPVDEWYVASKVVSRADFIKHLRTGDEAVVAFGACLAKATGGPDSRQSDMIDGRGEIHAQHAVLIDAGNVLRSDTNWPKIKELSRTQLGRWAQGAKSAANGSGNRLTLTDAQLKTMMRIQDSRRYKNDNQRKVAIEKEGIKPAPGRTWRIQIMPIIARERGIEL
jgi:hypothetical protein